MKTTETGRVSDELRRLKEEEEEEEEGERQIVGFAYKTCTGRLATLSIPTVRVEALEYS